MNRTLRAIIVAVALILVGAVLAGCSLFLMDGAWDALTGSSRLKTTQETITEDFSNIDMDIIGVDVTLFPSPDGTCYYKAETYDNMFCTALVENGTLKIGQDDSRKWYQHIGIYWENTSLELYLPKESYKQLTITGDTGGVTIPGDFVFENASIATSTGDMDIRAKVTGHLNAACSTGNISLQGSSALLAPAAKVLNITTSTGNVTIRDMNADTISVSTSTGTCAITTVSVQQKLSVSASTGNVQLMSVACGSLYAETNTGDVTLNNTVATGDALLKSDTGNVEFEGFDAANISITTDTGDVEGTLLTDKIFFIQTDTGDVEVPRTSSGGSCEITTDTGDIEIEIVPTGSSY